MKRQETKPCARRAVARWDGTADKPGYRELAKAAGQQGGVGVMVVFSSQAQSIRESDCKQKAPPASRYKKEIKAFLAENRFVHRVTGWNEPNFTTSRTARNPRRAARYWKRASAVCRRTKWCVEVPAGAFAGFAGSKRNPIRIKTRSRGVVTRNVGYMRAYKAEVSRGDYGNKRKNWPRIWAFHAWSDWRVYSAGTTPNRAFPIDTPKFRTTFSQEGRINGRGPYRLVDDYRYDADAGPGLSEVRPRIWVTEAGALYRLACSKVQTKRAKSKPCKRANETTDEAGTLIFGRRRQAQAAAFILKSLTRPLRVGDPPTPATPVRRLYYYNLQDTTGFKYKLRGTRAGFSGRCRTRLEGARTRVTCDRDDSGVIGSLADGRGDEEGYTGYLFQPNPPPPLSNPDEARGALCLLRDKTPRAVRRGHVKSCSG